MLNAKDVPPWAKLILDERAGKEHSADGAVMQALADILTPYKNRLAAVRVLAESWALCEHDATLTAVGNTLKGILNDI